MGSTILHGGSGQNYAFAFPSDVQNVKYLMMHLWNCEKICQLNGLKKLEKLELTCTKLVELDLSGLSNLTFVKIGNSSSLKSIKLNPTQTNIVFDFSEDRNPSDETVIMIGALEKSGFSVISSPIIREQALEIEAEAAVARSVSTNFTRRFDSYNSTSKRIDKNTNDSDVELTQNSSLINHSGDIDPRDYRKKIHTDIQLVNDELVFVPFALDEEKSEGIDLKSIRRVSKREFGSVLAKALHEEIPGSYLGVMTLSTENTQWIPLTCLTTKDNLTLLDEESIHALAAQGLSVEIRYTNETQQYFVRIVSINANNLNVATIPKEIQLYYGMCPNKENNTPAVSPIPLPEMLKKALEAFLALIPNWEPRNAIEECLKNKGVFDFCLSHEILRGLDYICHLAFSTKEIAPEITQYIKHMLANIGIENESVCDFMSILFAGAGSCRHRSFVFMALANHLKLPARINGNDVHASVEYFENNTWKQHDLGGSAVSKMTTLDSWAGKKEKESTGLQLISTTSSMQIPQTIENDNEFHSLFQVDEIILDESQGFNAWYHALHEMPGNPLLTFSHDQEAFDLHSRLMELPTHHLGDNYFYIHQPADFERLLKQLEIKADGQCHEIKGPLLRMIEKGEGTILINWSLFSEKQIANYKSILDSTPTLQGYSLFSAIKIVNIAKPSTEACVAFHSRTKKIAWPKKLEAIKIEKPSQIEATEDVIDLYESRDWESILVGKLQIQGDAYSFREGALLRSLRQNKSSICLTGNPNKNSFITFMERLQRERGFYANGQWHELPSHFKINFSPSPTVPAITEAYSFDRKEKRPVFYINKQNFNQYFEKYRIDQQGKAYFQDGILVTMSPDSILVITDELSDGERRKLQLALGEKSPTLPVKCLPHLLNDTAPENISLVMPLTPTTRLDSSTVILSDDIDAATRMIKTEEDIIVDISLVTEFSDLFENTTLKTDGSGRKNLFGQKTLGFYHETFELFDYMEKGGSVILKGPISNELYHQIETLFATPAYLVINGEHKKIRGQLLLITPENKKAPHFFSGTNNQYEHQFSWEAVPFYLMSTMLLNETEALLFTQRIKAFFDAAAKIKHDGKTTPPTLVLTEDRVLQLAKAMQQNLGKANPIKAIFHQSYTENEETYAQLSVLAKIHLSNSLANASVDKQKLLSLLNVNKANPEQVQWQILNCFSPMYLKENANITKSLKFNTIDEVNALLNELPDKKKSSVPRMNKQVQQVHELLKHSPYIELRGTPGTGKTYFIENEIDPNDGELFWGEDNIIAWLKNITSKKHYLLLDEANMKEPGYWDFLKGINSGIVHYKGKSYPVSSDSHKLIFTGNPENYPGRHHHTFLHQVPKVYFKSHTDAYLTEQIIGPLLAEKTRLLTLELRNEITRCVIAAYHLVKKELPFETIGIRGLKSLTDHFLCSSPTTEQALSQVYLASIEIFAGLFKNGIHRQHYIDSLKVQCKAEGAGPPH